MFYLFNSRFIIRKNSTWTKPEGYYTGIKIYNCVAKAKVPLITKKKNVITWYTCGPTVYDEAHIGHACCYLKIDIIQRILSKYFKIIIINAMNITDIDDKILKKSKESGSPWNSISSLYEKNFWNDLSKLKIRKPDTILRVSENMDVIKDFIQTLIDKDFTVKSNDGSLHFKVENLSTYGKLVKINSEEIGNSQKLNWALWKASGTNESFWDTPWGNGRPGWHVECSALASLLFGSCLDIHAGGMDLKFPHHENEEAQSCAYHNSSQWVNYWMHIGQLHANSSEKMSKSLKNTISVSELLQHTRPDEFRFACLLSHYRSRMEYSTELMKMAKQTLKKYRDFIENCSLYIENKFSKNTSDELSVKNLLIDSQEAVHNAFCDDFDTPEIINILNKIVRIVNPLLNSDDVSVSTVIGLKNFFRDILNLFDIAERENVNVTNDSRNEEMLEILKCFREKIRHLGLASKDVHILKLCDEVRSNLREIGIDIRDSNKARST